MARGQRTRENVTKRRLVSRRTVAAALAVTGVVLFVVLRWSSSTRPSPAPVILISIDTLRADHLPAYGSRSVRTPAIDALAAEGIVFENAYAHAPQTPYTPPARFKEYAPYDGEIAAADEIVGRLVASLKRRGFYDDALIVLLSDHGEGLGDHGEQEHGLFLYRETIRVPLIIRLPRQLNAGRRIATPVQHIDLVPTILDSLMLPAKPGLRGRSLVPLFTGDTIPE